MGFMRIFILVIVSLLSCSTFANDAKKTNDEKKTPYFASIWRDKANVRTGPNSRYPIRWVYEKENWPVKVVAEFDKWYKIEDIYGEAGWVFDSLISSKRTVITQSEGVQKIYKLPLVTSKVIAIAENGVISDLEFCKNNWCKISLSERKGWIESKYLWGVD